MDNGAEQLHHRQFSGQQNNRSPLRIGAQNRIHGISSSELSNQRVGSNGRGGSIDEEEKYNRRRQEGLRANAAAQSSQFLQPSFRLNEQPTPPSNLRMSQQQERQSLQQQQPVTSHFTLSASNNNQMPLHIREHLSHLQNDNASLMRRLNLVHQELERITREKGDLQSQLTHWMQQATDCYDQLNKEDNFDRVNKYMKDDLIYERDRNQKLKLAIQEMNEQILRMAEEVRGMEREQELIIRNNQENTYVLQKHLSQISDLEKEQYFNQERIKETALAIDNTRQECSDLDTSKYSIRQAIELVMAERNELIDKVTQLSQHFDDTVRDITNERQLIQTESATHAKFITAKILGNHLHSLYQGKLLTGFQEIVTYTNFDSKCNAKLKCLSKLLEKAGTTKLKIVLNHWFSCALKPVQTMESCELLSQESGRIKLTSKFFQIWLRAFQARVNSYDQKTKAVQKIWSRLQEEARIEERRAFRIWRELFSRFRLQKYKLRRFLCMQHFKQLNYSLSAWKNSNSYYDSQVRLGILTQDFTHKQYLRILYNHFHIQSINLQNRRRSKLRHCLKAWQDYLATEKYLQGLKQLSDRFQLEVFTSNIKTTFDQWRFEKQKRLYLKAHESLHSDEMERIRELTEGNDEIRRERRRVNIARGFEAVKVKLQKRLWSYLNHWRQINVHYHESLATTVNDKITRLYFEKARVAVNRWKMLHSKNKLIERKGVNTNLQLEQVALENQVKDLTEQNKYKTGEQKYQAERHLHKVIQNFEKITMQMALGRWRDNMNELITKQNGAFTLMRRLRIRLCRKSLDLFIEGINYKKKVELQEANCRKYQKLRGDRMKAVCLNAWSIFKGRHLTAKDYWYRIILKLDLSMKRQATKRWKEATQITVEESLIAHQQSIIENNDELNHQIGQLHQFETEQQQVLKVKKSTLTLQAQRVLSNKFARFHSVNMTRGFEKWRQWMEFINNRNRMLDKAAQHSKKNQFNVVKGVFKNWIMNANIVERLDELKKENMRVNDTLFQTQLQEEAFEETRTNIHKAIECENIEAGIFNGKLQRTVKLIVKRVNDNHYTTKQRYILQQWNNYSRDQVHFINTIQRILTKSVVRSGFQEIKDIARNQHLGECTFDIMTTLFTSFTKRVQLNALSRWRGGDYATVKECTAVTIAETEAREEAHATWKDKVKTNNALKAEKRLTEWLMRNSLKAWQNVARYLKLQREKNALCQLEINASRERQAIYKWRARKQATKELRTYNNRRIEEIRKMKLRTYFKFMQKSFFQNKEMAMRLSNLTTMFDHNQLQTALSAIKSFSRAKTFVYDKRKENASIWFCETFEALFKRKKLAYLTELRIRAINKRKVDTLKKLTVSLQVNNTARFFFQKWKEQSEKIVLAIELYEEGRIRQEDVNYKSELKNIKELMNKEGYDDIDLNKALNGQLGRQKGLLLKGIRRLQHFNSQLYVVPKMFDRWKEFIQTKKRFRYWLQFVEKRGQLVKADMHYAFDKWKKFHPEKESKLVVQSKEELNRKAVANSKQLDALAEKLIEKENVIDHLNAQRETLLDNYIKGQKLVLSLWASRHRHAMHSAFMQWMDKAKRSRGFDSQEILKRNLDTLEQLKARILQLEQDNEVLANENEELRQFSLDGYEIAKNVQTLSAERELLSVDLADKAQVIKKLLDENEGLTRKLSKAQEHAQTLIRSTMRRGGGSAGYLGSRSVRT